MENKNRGSEWRKWDLHIHSPASFYWNGTKKYREMSRDEVINEIKTFIKIINESDIEVFCLMDYWTFDWYLELQEYIVNNPNELKKTVLPGMELRVESPTSYRLNVHFILSDKLTKQQLIDFKSELYIRSIDKKLSNDSLILFAKSLDVSKAKHHSFDDPKNLSEEKLLQLGAQTAEITKESLHNAFKQIPDLSGFVFLPYDTSDGLLKLDWKKHPHADNYFMQTADIFESRDQVNIDLISGKRTEENESIFENFFKTLGNKSKPCVAGSDAHKYSDFGKFPSNKITWIKAQPTFEGLKQIIYEPEERVKIQKEMPEAEKLDNLMIEKVTFTSSHNKFTSNPIYFNKNLNVIIGGKSSGKSILLYNIARTLSTDDNLFKDESIENKYNFRENNEDNSYTDLEYNFEVNTKVDGVSQKRFDENNKNIIPDVKYIPQNYLIKLAEPEQYKKGESLNKIIRKLIIEDKTSKDGYNDFLLNVKANDKKRENLIKEYLDLKEKILSLDESLKGKSDKLTLEKNIESNLNKINELKKNVGLTQEEINRYNDLQDDLKEINSNRDKIINDYKKIKTFNQQVIDQLNKISNDKKNIVLTLENDKIKYDFENKYLKLEELTTEINQYIKSYEIIINEEGVNKFINENIFKSLLNDINKCKKESENQLDYFRKNEEVEKHIKILENSIEESRKNLSSITKITNEKLIFEKELKKKKIDLFLLYISNFREYIGIIENLRNRVSGLDKDGLKITGLIQFNFPKFRNKMLEISHGGSKTYKKWNIFEENYSALYNYNIKKFIKDIKEVFKSIDNDEYILLSKIDKSHAINNLLDDYFFDYWQVEYKKDKLGKMSTGKASFVILMIIIGLSDSKTPILIDQPEDNLDNRSVTNDLVKYLKEKKKERQIILVTHNANIVVNADAENIIVANQKGQNEDDEEGSIYQFDYINGALEDTFQKNKDIKDLLKSMGIREHIAEIVEGGKEAFKKREEKYGF